MNASSKLPERAKAFKLKAHSDTLEDWLATVSPPVRDQRLDRCFTVIEEGGATELLTVSPDNKLLHIRRTEAGSDLPGSPAPLSDSAWACETFEVKDTRQEDHRWKRGPIAEINAFFHQGRRYALVHFEEDTQIKKRRYIEPLSYDPKGGWSSWKLTGETVVALFNTADAEIFVDSQGQPLLCGKPSGYASEEDVFAVVFFHQETPGQGAWEAVRGRFEKKGTKELSYRLIANDDPKSLGTLLRSGNGTVVEYQRIAIETPPDEEPRLQCSQSWSSQDLAELIGPVGDLSGARLVPLPERPGCFLVHAVKDHHVYLVTGFETKKPAVRCLTRQSGAERPATLIRAGLDRRPADGRPGSAIVLALVDKTAERRLWVCRETAGGTPLAPTFGSWVPLGQQARACALPRSMPGGTELFLVDDDDQSGGVAIAHQRLEHSGEVWQKTVLKTAARSLDEPRKCVTHTTRLLLSAQDGSPAYRAAADLNASVPCTVSVNGVSRHLGPLEPVRVFADGAGHILIRFQADDAHAPVYTVKLPESGASPSRVVPNQAVTRRLSGQDGHHLLDQSRLVKAGLIPKKLAGQTQGEQLTAALRAAGEAMAESEKEKKDGDVGTSRRAREKWFWGSLVEDQDGVPSWRIRSGRGRLPKTLVASSDENEEIVCAHGQPDPNWGFVGDVFHWLYAAGRQLLEWSFKPVSNGFEFIFKFASKTFNLVVSTSQGILRGMETLFKLIADAVGEAIDAAKRLLDAVKALFEIEAIRRTNTCFQYCINGGLLAIEKMIKGSLNDWLRGLVDQAVAGASSSVDQLEKYLNNLTLGTVAQSGIPDKEGGGSSFAERSGLIAKGDIQARWVADRLIAHSDRLQPAFSSSLSAETDRLAPEIEKIAKLVHSSDPDKVTLFSLAAKVCGDMKADLERGVSAMSLFKIFEHCRTLLKLTGDLVKEIVSLVLGLLAEGLKQLRLFLQAEIRIPGVDQLAKLVLGQSLTLLDIFTLLFAVGATVFHKLLREGKEPFPAELTQELLGSGLFPSQTGAARESDPAPAHETDDSLPSFLLCSFVVLLAEFVGKKPADQDIAVLRKHSGWAKKNARKLARVATIINVTFYCVMSIAGVSIWGAGDALDMGTYSLGSKTLGALFKILFLAGLALTLVSIYFGYVRWATLKLHPDSPEAEFFRKRPQGPALLWQSLVYLPSAVFAILGGICLTAAPQPAGAYVNAGLNVILGLVLFAAATAGLVMAVKDGKLLPWQIANLVGTLVGSFWWTLAFTPAVIHYNMVSTQGLILLLAPFYFLIVTGGTIASYVTLIGKEIEEAIAEGWG